MFRVIGDKGWGQYSVLAPGEIASLYNTPYGATSSIAIANVIAALNGPMAHIYLKGDNWADTTPDPAELANLAEFIRVYLADNGNILSREVKEVIKNLLSSVDTILIRDDGEYKLFKGPKFNDLGKVVGSDADFIEETTLDPIKYIDAMKRIEGLNDPERSGDIVLIMKDKTDGNVLDRYTSGVACKSWHGSLNPSDSYVPFIVTYPGGNKDELSPIVEKACDNGICEGNWQVTDMVKKIIETQYTNQ